MKRSILTLSIICFTVFGVFGQIDSTQVEINNHIWKPFSEAYANLDFNLYESIHHQDFIRVNGNQDVIKSREDYLRQYQQNWEKKDRNLKIEFRFLERIYSEDTASERGIYKLTINAEEEDKASYFGKFHVIIKKVSGKWKLLVDYDSNEENTIGEEQYNSAFALNETVKN